MIWGDLNDVEEEEKDLVFRTSYFVPRTSFVMFATETKIHE